MKQTNRKGFTLAELLIVVAIIAVLVAIAIPVFTTQLHNARVAADVANVRAYYAEIQSDFLTSREKKTIIYPSGAPSLSDFTLLKHLDGTTTELKEGTYYIAPFDEDNGYTIHYDCNKGEAVHPEHTFVFTNDDFYKQ